MWYFWIFLLIGIFLLSNLLLAQIFLNYKKLINTKLKRYSDQVEAYFRSLFDKITNGEAFMTVKQFTEALGGEEIVQGDKRLQNLIWQAEIILDGKIQFQDFAYVLEFTDTIEQQKVQLDRIKRFIKAKEKYDARSKSYDKAREKIQKQKTLMNSAGLGTVGNMLSMSTFSMPGLNLEQDVEDEIVKEEDAELIKAIQKQNRKTCFCFK